MTESWGRRCGENNYENVNCTCMPGAPGSTPESKIAMTTPLPSYSGYLSRNWLTPVSFLGNSAQTGKLMSTTSSMLRTALTQRCQSHTMTLAKSLLRPFLCIATALYIHFHFVCACATGSHLSYWLLVIQKSKTSFDRLQKIIANLFQFEAKRDQRWMHNDFVILTLGIWRGKKNFQGFQLWNVKRYLFVYL